MKKNLFFAALALVALASCSDEQFVNENNNSPNPGTGTEQAIVFNSGTNAITRATWTGGKAAEMLNNNFVFAGTKSNGTTAPTSFVFDQYYANWVENTANTTQSNSNDWEYVGYTPASTSNLPSGATQTIKFWDYATKQYDFAAYSLGKGYDADGDASTTNDITYATASAIAVGDKSYTLTGSAEELKACYISDLVTAYNRDGVKDYGNVVTFSFRSLAAKIRLAFYETVPGYSVKDVYFYNAAEFTSSTGVFGTSAIPSTTPTLLTANDAATLPTGRGTMTITFPTTGFTKRPGGDEAATDYNKAHIAFAAASTGSNLSSTLDMFNALANFATERDGVLDPSGNYLGRASNAATYAGGIDAETGQGKYYTILPNEDPKDLMIRIKYKLVSTDGSNEEITVDNASAVIPKELAKWSPNYAYTYIFKISDLTNGSTGTDGSGNIVCGLTPITLNAVVVDSEDGLQETITTVSHPSITTYSQGKVVTVNNEYNNGAPIYVIVNNGTSNVSLTTTNAKLYTATTSGDALQGITEETVDNALRYGEISGTNNNIYTVTDANNGSLQLIDITPTSATGLNATDPADDWLVQKILAADSPTGNEIVLTTTANDYKAAKFIPDPSTIYVFQYLKNESSATPLVYTAVPVKTLAAGTYYTKSGNTYTAMTVTDEQATNGTYKVFSGTGSTVYYTLSDSYVRIQSNVLVADQVYYTESAGVYTEHTATGGENALVNTYYEKISTYTSVPYAQLATGTYYTSDRGAGKFTVTSDDVVYVDTENKYYTFTSGTPAEYQYKIIKVQ